VRIDVHTHVVPERWEDWAARYGGGNWPRLEHREKCRATIFTGGQFFREIDHRSWDPARRLEDMDQLRIDVQVLSPPPVMFCYWADAKANAAFARMQNAGVAEIAAKHGQRFVGMATVPLQDVALAIDELRYAHERLGLRAVEIGTCPGGRDFDDSVLLDFFAACVDLDVAVFVHPAAPLIGLDRMKKYYFPLIVGNPLETALAISKLIFGGVLERLPGLRICFAHGGGAFPFTLARLNHGWAVRPEGPAAIPREPRDYARRIWVDSLTLGASNLKFIVGELGMDRVVMGSDYPFDMGSDDPVGAVESAGLAPAARAAILDGANAARFLGLPAA
jgi:aminocarboxymuconate-semialdehyde decarboxylase